LFGTPEEEKLKTPPKRKRRTKRTPKHSSSAPSVKGSNEVKDNDEKSNDSKGGDTTPKGKSDQPGFGGMTSAGVMSNPFDDLPAVSAPYLPPLADPNRYTLVLDLDETLAHYFDVFYQLIFSLVLNLTSLFAQGAMNF
jgi:hypothetical protein